MTGYDLGHQIRHEYDGERYADFMAERADEREARLLRQEIEVTMAYETLLDRIDDCLIEYHRQVRERNVRTLSRGTYRVELSGRRDTNPVNLDITPNARDPQGFRFQIHEDADGLGRVTGHGTVHLWPSVDGNDPRVKKALMALDVLLGAETPGRYGKAYARVAGRCYRCHLKLTKEDSIDRMMGPVCARKAAAGER